MAFINADDLTLGILDAIEEGVRLGLEEIQMRAQKHAPVRDIFKHPRGRSRKQTSADVSSMATSRRRVGSIATGGPRRVYVGGAPHVMSARKAQQLGFFTTGTMPSRTGHRVLQNVKQNWTLRDSVWKVSGSETVHYVGKGVIRGRANSLAPVVSSPAGLIGSESFRHWAGPNVLEIGAIRSKGNKGGFELSSLLSARGRYEAFGAVEKNGARAGKGRAVYMSHGQETIGGRLRDGITIVGPLRNGPEIYGFVKAVAVDPDSKKQHNYATDQEFGTRHHKAQPFLRPGLLESVNTITRVTDPSKDSRGRGLMQKALESAVQSGGSGVDVPFVLTATYAGPESMSRDFWAALGKAHPKLGF
jgi:hypothetical protein